MEKKIINHPAQVEALLEAAKTAFTKNSDHKQMSFEECNSLLQAIQQVQNMQLTVIEKEFPNGFTSWHETHYEVVNFITLTIEKNGEGKEIQTVSETHGTDGLYQLAEEWTDEFEKLNEGREWDGEFFDEVEVFLNKKNHI